LRKSSEFATQAENRAQKVRPIGVVGRESLQFGDKGVEDTLLGLRLTFYRSSSPRELALDLPHLRYPMFCNRGRCVAGSQTGNNHFRCRREDGVRYLRGLDLLARCHAKSAPRPASSKQRTQPR
jgi:hypothetical protein